MKLILLVLSILTFMATAIMLANHLPHRFSRSQGKESSGRTKIKLPRPTRRVASPRLVHCDSLVVIKSKGILNCYYRHKLQKAFTCATGSAEGHKQMEGDNRTPEGIYYITERNRNSKYFRNLHINYPNAKDIERCRKNKVPTGGDIKVHGYADAQGNTTDMQARFSYTWGCVALNNADMLEVYNAVQLGSPINILK